MQSMSSQASSWTLMEDFFVQECCVQGTDLENHGPTLILCDDPLPIESSLDASRNPVLRILIYEHEQWVFGFVRTKKLKLHD